MTKSERAVSCKITNVFCIAYTLYVAFCISVFGYVGTSKGTSLFYFTRFRFM